MSKDEETKGPDAPAEAAESAPAAPKQRKIVRRSMSTRDNPAFTTEVEGAKSTPEPGAEAATPRAPALSEAPSTLPTGAMPAGAIAAPASSDDRPRPSASGAPGGPRRFDARAPRAASDSRGPRPGGPRPRGPRRDFDDRSSGPRPAGMRPVPGGPRYPAPDRPRRDDDRPPEARPAGMRPLPGGPRHPAREGEQGGRDRFRDRPPRRDGDDRPRRADGESRPAPVPPPSKPAPKPVPVPPPSAAKPAAPKAQPIVIPLGPAPRAGGPLGNAKPVLTAKEAMAAKAKAAAAKIKQIPVTPPPPAPEKREEVHRTTIEIAMLHAGWDDARAALKKAGDDALLLIEAWLTSSNVAPIAAIAEAEDVAPAARKAARRALGVLKARGVAIPATPRIVRMDDRATVSLEATLLPPDGSGAFSLSVTSKDAAGRYHIAEVIAREPIGILQAASGWLSGSQLKEGRSRAQGDFGVAPATVPVEWARHRISELKKLNARSGQILPLGLEGCRDLIAPVEDEAPAHPVADLEPSVTNERVTSAATGSATLHFEPEFRTWVPDRASLDEMLAKVGERLGVDGLSDQDKVSAAIKEEIDAATDRFFSPEVRKVIATRMRDSAISVRARLGADRAIDVLAVARAIVDAGLITSPPREIGFLVRFFEKGLAALASQGGGQVRIPVQPGAPVQPPAAEATEGS